VAPGAVEPAATCPVGAAPVAPGAEVAAAPPQPEATMASAATTKANLGRRMVW